MFVILKESEFHHSTESLIDRAHPSLRTNRDLPLPLQMSSDSNGLYWSSELGEPRLSGSLCCDEAQDSFVITNTQQLSPINNVCTYICMDVHVLVIPLSSVVHK